MKEHYVMITLSNVLTVPEDITEEDLQYKVNELCKTLMEEIGGKGWIEHDREHFDI